MICAMWNEFESRASQCGNSMEDYTQKLDSMTVLIDLQLQIKGLAYRYIGA